jgi:hypothetical protein
MSDMDDDLQSAYAKRLDWLSAELSECRSSTMRSLLEKAQILTSDCAKMLLVLKFRTNEKLNHFAERAESAAAGAGEAVKLPKLYHVHTERQGLMDFLESVTALSVKSANDQFTMLAAMSAHIELTQLLLATCLTAILETSDGTASKALFAELKDILNSVAISAIGVMFLIPTFAELAATMIGLVHDVVNAREKQRTSANDYAVFLEKYSAACLSWCETVMAYVAGLQLVARDPSLVKPG